jgi:tRNA(Ile)-lysidine synthase
MELLTAVYDFCQRYGTKQTYWLAFSGGLDSHVLLKLMQQVAIDLTLTLKVIHIHHGLNKEADQWLLFCQQLCIAYHLPFVARTISIEPLNAESVEQAARRKRYAAIKALLGPDDILLTAHHQDDQAETLLLQLLRGAGMKGLAAMPQIKSFGLGLHGRPLLPFTRAQLFKYAKQENLQWIEDEMNNDTRHMRNFIRQQIVPQLKMRVPGLNKVLTRTALHMAEAQDLLMALAQEKNAQAKGSVASTLSVAKCLQQSLPMQRLMLRTWISDNGFPVPNTAKLQTIQQTVLNSRWHKMPSVAYQNIAIKRYGDDLYIVSIDVDEPLADRLWQIEQPLLIPGWGLLQAKQALGQGMLLKQQQVWLRFRRGGEVVAMPGLGHKTLKHLMQEWRIPPWQRGHLPLLYDRQTLIAIPGFYQHKDYLAPNNQYGWVFQIKPAM